MLPVTPRAVVFDVYNTLLEIGAPPAGTGPRWRRLVHRLTGAPPALAHGEFLRATERVVARHHAAARAAGIPSREVAGLIYIGGAQPGFYFHQWASVWVGQWVDMDPTFDQPAVDATHVKLAEGDLYRQARIIPIIGNLKIEVLPDEGPDLFAEAEAAAAAAGPDATGAGEPEPEEAAPAGNGG